MNDLKNNNQNDREQTDVEAKTSYKNKKREFITIIAPHITIAIAMIALAAVAWWGLNLILPQSDEQMKETQSDSIKQVAPEMKEMELYLTSSLKLTTEEARKFWPIYNEYISKRDKLTQEKNTLMETITRNFADKESRELTEAGDRLIEINIKKAKLAAEYHILFGKVLPPEKVILLYGAEMQSEAAPLKQLQQLHK